MSDAIEMRLAKRRFSRRLVASMLGISLVLCMVLGARHEAQAGHWTDRTGQLRHAVALATTVVSDQPSAHRATTTPDLDPCELAAARHAPTSAEVAQPELALHIQVALVAITSTAANVVETRVVYRLAPKTSPPAA